MKYYFLVTIILLFIISFSLGLIVYKKDKNKRFSLLSFFPFEMESSKYGYLTLIFRLSYALDMVVMIIYNYYLFYYLGNLFLLKVLGIIGVLIPILNISLFVIKMREYKGHLFMFSLFNVLIILSFELFGYIGITHKDYLNLTVSIISVIIGFILLIFMLTPSFLTWSKGNKVVEDKEIRKKINILALSEWISIFSYLLFYILITIGTL